MTASAEPSESWRDWWEANFLWLEFGLSVAFGLLSSVWLWGLGGGAAANAALASNWPTFFSSLVTLFGALFGFVVATNSIVVSLLSEKVFARFSGTKSTDDIWETLFQTNCALGSAALVSLVGLVSSSDVGAHILVLTPLAFLGAFTFARLARTIWILDQLARTKAHSVRVAGGETPSSHPASADESGNQV